MVNGKSEKHMQDVAGETPHPASFQQQTSVPGRSQDLVLSIWQNHHFFLGEIW
jgi:hypothetical protein